jgi:hypothetical protein
MQVTIVSQMTGRPSAREIVIGTSPYFTGISRKATRPVLMKFPEAPLSIMQRAVPPCI